jgi:hypothetical protein
MTEEEAFQDWFKEHWRYASSTNIARAREAWLAARDAFITSQLLDDLHIDPERAVMAENLGENFPRTGIFIRAKDQNGKYQSVDMALLKKASLLALLRSRGGQNEWAENTVGLLLGHGVFHDRWAKGYLEKKK